MQWALIVRVCVVINSPVAAASARYVFTIARSWSAPSTRAELKLGQNSQRNSVPIIANMSDVYEGPSCWPAALSSLLGRRMQLTARPKYAPNACTVIEPPTSVTCTNWNSVLLYWSNKFCDFSLFFSTMNGLKRLSENWSGWPFEDAILFMHFEAFHGNESSNCLVFKRFLGFYK